LSRVSGYNLCDIISIQSLFIMKFTPFYLFTLLFSIISACAGDYRPHKTCAIDEVFIVMDSTQWDSKTAKAIHETFGRTIETSPSPRETSFTLTFRDFRTNSQLNDLKNMKNVIFASPLHDESYVSEFIGSLLNRDLNESVKQEKSFAFQLEDEWARDQWALILTSVSDDLLAEKILDSEENLVGRLLDREFDRRKNELFRRGEQIALSDSLWEKHGWKVRIQHDYINVYESSNAVIFRRYLPDNNRWIWAWWMDDVEKIDSVDLQWIHSKRDSLMQDMVQGERDGSFVTTDYREPLKIRKIHANERLTGFEAMGTWRMTNDFMGGPFVHFTYHDPETKRLFMIEYAQFAPRLSKRRFVRQFQAMGRTFESDSIWGKNIRNTDF